MYDAGLTTENYDQSDIHWVLPALGNSWIIIQIWLYTALNRTPSIDCYLVGAVPKTSISFSVLGTATSL